MRRRGASNSGIRNNQLAIAPAVSRHPLPRERARGDVHKHPLYYAVRNHIIDFLVSRSRGFSAEAGAGYDARHVPLVRPGLPEPSIATSGDLSMSLPGLTRQSIAKA